MRSLNLKIEPSVRRLSFQHFIRLQICSSVIQPATNRPFALITIMQSLYDINEDIIVAMLLCCDVFTILRVEQVCDQNRPSLVHHLTNFKFKDLQIS